MAADNLMVSNYAERLRTIEDQRQLSTTNLANQLVDWIIKYREADQGHVDNYNACLQELLEQRPDAEMYLDARPQVVPDKDEFFKRGYYFSFAAPSYFKRVQDRDTTTTMTPEPPTQTTTISSTLDVDPEPKEEEEEKEVFCFSNNTVVEPSMSPLSDFSTPESRISSSAIVPKTPPTTAPSATKLRSKKIKLRRSRAMAPDELALEKQPTLVLSTTTMTSTIKPKLKPKSACDQASSSTSSKPRHVSKSKRTPLPGHNKPNSSAPCMPCRRSKAKCDLKLPCENCKKLQYKCSYYPKRPLVSASASASSKRTGRNKPGPSRARFSEGNSRLNPGGAKEDLHVRALLPLPLPPPPRSRSPP